MKRWWIMLGSVVALIVVAGGIWGFNLWRMLAAFKAAGQPRQVVTAMHAQPELWHDYLQAVGTVRAVRGVDVAPEVTGTVDSIHFESGDDVRAGALLVELRAADERAKLDALRAAADLAATVYERDQVQLKAKVISQAQVDADTATLNSAKAQVVEQQAIIDKKMIHAPFAGRLGIRQVDVGQYVAAGTKLVTLQALDPVHVDFSLPQQALANLRVGQPVTVTADVFPDAHFDGKVTAIDPAVAVGTRNVQVRATLKNSQFKLLPGMFVRVAIEIGDGRQYLTLPQTAVTYNPYGEAVFLVKPQASATSAKEAPHATGNNSAEALVAEQVFVKVGPKRGDQVAIVSGITESDQVVTSGQLKLRNGTPIAIDNSVVPSNNPAPTPREE